MNLGQLRESLARDILKSDEVNESLTTSLRFVHKELQRDLDWRCMEALSPELTYLTTNAVGIQVAATSLYKKSYEVYDVVGGQLLPILPTTEADANKLRRIAQNTRGAQPTEAGYQQRWYESNLKVVLLIAPSTDRILQVRYYQYLPFYDEQQTSTATITEDPATTGSSQILVSSADDDKFVVGQSVVLSTDSTIIKTVTAVNLTTHKITLNSTLGLSDGDVLNLGATSSSAQTATDWFSINLPEALLFGAAYHESKNGGEDQRAETFLKRYTELVQMAFDADSAAKQGGAYRVRRPTLPNEAQGRQ